MPMRVNTKRSRNCDLTDVGIDDINLAAGSRYVDFASMVGACDTTDADLERTGFVRRTVLDVWEDPVTLAAAAARPLLQKAHDIGLLLVGTETGLDHGKPVSSYLHRVLNLGPNCRNGEIKHACYSPTLALRLACSWVRENIARKALVVGTDICRIHSGGAALSVGCGAVAMMVTARPRVFTIDTACGVAAEEVWDVARPSSRLELVDGPLSIAAYLDAVETAWAGLRASGNEPGDFEYLLYHCPIVSLVRQAHALITGTTSDFAERVEPSLRLNCELGNIYGSSVYASLLSVIECCEPTPGQRACLFSYGSGSCAELVTGRFGRESGYAKRHRVPWHLATRRRCTAGECFKADSDLATQLEAREYEVPLPDNETAVRLERIQNWHRTYRVPCQ